MCMIDYADGSVTELTVAFRVARKQHKCTECYRAIQAGESYLYETHLWDGRINTCKTCSHCQIVCKWLTAECGGYVYGGVKDDIREHAYEGYGMDVARLAVAMTRKWVRRDGSLRPVPVVPQTTHDAMRAMGSAP